MTFEIVDPANGEVVRVHQEMTSDEIDGILDRGVEAQAAWGERPFAERSALMSRAAEVLLDGRGEHADLMATEMGKIHAQGIAEVEKCALVCRFYAENAERFLSREQVETEAHDSFVTFKPLGTLLAIMPWNFPFWQLFRFAAPALMAGNAAVLKHAPSVFGCSLAIEKVFRDAGFPPDLFRSLILDVPQTTEVIRDPRVAAVTITASVGAGRAVAAEAGRVLKKCVLELGGSDAYVVLEDADIDRAVEVGITARYQNTGQSCIAAKRFILVDAIRDEFESKFVERVGRLRTGLPRQEGTDIGPMARVALRDELHDQVRRTVDAGAKLLIGGEIPDRPGAWYPPTVLAGVREGMAAWSEELFGPVATLISVRDEEEAIRVANATTFGLGGAVWTRDLERGARIAADRIRSGACFVNDMSKSDPRMPFGGIKDSGYGRELSSFGIREFVNVHAVWVSE